MHLILPISIHIISSQQDKNCYFLSHPKSRQNKIGQCGDSLSIYCLCKRHECPFKVILFINLYRQSLSGLDLSHVTEEPLLHYNYNLTLCHLNQLTNLSFKLHERWQIIKLMCITLLKVIMCVYCTNKLTTHTFVPFSYKINLPSLTNSLTQRLVCKHHA